MSVGHVQRAIETAGVPTVSVYIEAFSHAPNFMNLPRTVITNHPLGRPLGAPGDVERQRAVVEKALSLFGADSPTIVNFDEPYRPGPAATG